jgi:hypothetical protein
MELRERVKTRLQIANADEDALIDELVIGATDLFLSLRYPTTDYPVDEDGNAIIEQKYKSWIVRVAVEVQSKMGAEGQTGHLESGIHRLFNSGTVSKELLHEVTPIAGVY